MALFGSWFQVTTTQVTTVIPITITVDLHNIRNAQVIWTVSFSKLYAGPVDMVCHKFLENILFEVPNRRQMACRTDRLFESALIHAYQP